MSQSLQYRRQRRTKSNQSGSKPHFKRGGYRSGGNNRRRPAGRTGKYIDPARFVKAAKPIEETTYEPQHSFEDFDLHDKLKENLRERNFTTPTQIQDQSVPLGLAGHDVVGIANTGTGKTCAFMLPALNKLIHDKRQKLLVIAPTRELALQIQTESRAFARGTRLRDVLLIGGTPMHRQLSTLKNRPEIIIGTPGRIKDHLERGSLRLDQVATVVLDEVDRMLDMGFIVDIRHILSHLPERRQSLFYSATMNPTVERLITSFTHDARTVMAKTAETSDNVEQTVANYKRAEEKMDKLHRILHGEEASKTLIFCDTRRAVEYLSKDLVQNGFKASAMHGNKSQSQRQRALRKFRDGDLDILVATDVAARGIDVDGITHVINYDIPQTYEDYTHRIGRAGRGNQIGHSVTFVNQR